MQFMYSRSKCFFFHSPDQQPEIWEESTKKKMNVSGGNFSMPASLLLLIERARDTSAIRHSFGSSKNAGRNIGQCVLWLWWTILSIDLAAHIGVVWLIVGVLLGLSGTCNFCFSISNIANGTQFFPSQTKNQSVLTRSSRYESHSIAWPGL